MLVAFATAAVLHAIALTAPAGAEAVAAPAAAPASEAPPPSEETVAAAVGEQTPAAEEPAPAPVAEEEPAPVEERPSPSPVPKPTKAEKSVPAAASQSVSRVMSAPRSGDSVSEEPAEIPAAAATGSHAVTAPVEKTASERAGGVQRVVTEIAGSVRDTSLAGSVRDLSPGATLSRVSEPLRDLAPSLPPLGEPLTPFAATPAGLRPPPFAPSAGNVGVLEPDALRAERRAVTPEGSSLATYVGAFEVPPKSPQEIPAPATEPTGSSAPLAAAMFAAAGPYLDASAGGSHNSPSAPPAPPLDSPGAASGAGGTLFVPLAALLALLALAAPASLRRLGEAPAARAPTRFVCALERPG